MKVGFKVLNILLFFFMIQAAWSQTDQELLDDIEKELAGQQPSTDTTEPKASGQGSVVDRANMPGIWVIADFVSNQYIDSAKEQKTSVGNVREIEAGFSGGIDHTAIGTVTLAAHNEQGAFFVELHEAFLEFNNLPWNMRFKAGRMFGDFGYLHSMHIHARPFTNAPLVFEEIFNDDEGALDFGGELAFLMPWDFYQVFKIGVFNGRTLGHTHNDGVNKPLPLLSARLKQFAPLGSSWGLQFGFTGLHYSPSESSDEYDITGGADIRLKWERGKLGRFQLGSEVYYQAKERILRDSAVFGFYSFVAYRPWQLWEFGFRYDHLVGIDKFSAALQKKFDSLDTAQSVFVTLIPSEFAYFRVSFERHDIFLVDTDDLRIVIQADFLIGYHPPHAY